MMFDPKLPLMARYERMAELPCYSRATGMMNIPDLCPCFTCNARRNVLANFEEVTRDGVPDASHGSLV